MSEMTSLLWLLLFSCCGHFCNVEAVVLRHEIPGSNFTLDFEWSPDGQPLTEADYYFMTPDYAESYPDLGSRPGHSTTTHTCDEVRGVPASLRSASNIRPSGLSYFYQKYTEAYGIPVLGSRNVPDNALRRACYVLRFLLADHSEVRQSYFRLSGRVAVIGVQEGAVSIPEHAWLGTGWNDKVRGLGATQYAPVSTGGEENILCYTEDRHSNEDILLRELAHGISLLGAKYAIRDWQDRLQSLYYQARSAGKWQDTYAGTTVEEYFAEGTQSYFNNNAFSFFPNGVHNHINSREKLRQYDPELFSLLQEVFPCGNNYIHRCDASRNRELNQQLRMNCNLGGNGNRLTTATQAPVTTTTPTVPPATSATVTETTTTVTQTTPVTQTTTPVVQTMPSVTQTSAPVTHSPVVVWGSCRDNHINCRSWSQSGECSTNPNYMHMNCKRSCGRCNQTGGISRPCTDTSPYCNYWTGIGECTRNPVFMRSSCRRSCGQCQ